MQNWIEAESTGHYFFYVFPVVLLLLLVLMKGRRVRFLVPSLIITVLIVNPVFYTKWTELGMYAYWRILWIVPVIPVVAALVPAFTEKLVVVKEKTENQKFWSEIITGAIVIFGVIGIVLGGSFIYNTERGRFDKVTNIAKIPGYVQKIADRLLELDDHPRVIAQNPIGVYIRQYTGDIDILFGRDINGYIYTPSVDAVKIDEAINGSKADMSFVSQFMADNGYKYLIIPETQRTEGFFELKDSISGYGIYSSVATPKILKERNELGQVTAQTTLDESGLPARNFYGYATEHHEYDAYGRVIKEWFTDECGEPVTQTAGYIAITQEWDGMKLISRTYLDSNGNPVNRIDGYSKAVWEQNETCTNVKFYDVDGKNIPIDGLNLATDIKYGSDEWSEWIIPAYNTANYCKYIGFANLGEKEEGTIYTCQLEIEFKDVTASDFQQFLFQTQGPVDGRWNIGNIWSPKLICLSSAPKDGVYRFVLNTAISEQLARSSTFQIGFRCDGWASGSFRIRKLKIEKGDIVSEWSPGV